MATVAIGGAANAGLLAARILGVGDLALQARMAAFMRKQEKSVLDKASKLERLGYEEYLEGYPYPATALPGPINVLVLGSGGREHAFSRSLTQSPNLKELFIAPGNAGTAQLGTNVALDILDFPAVEALCRQKEIGLIIVGPEVPLAEGISDYFAKTDIPLVGPSQAGAELESSKAFSKEFMKRHNVPTAAYKTFQAGDLNEALEYLQTHPLPIVVKASGLAAGKGVVICASREDACEEVKKMLSGSAFGSAGETVVIEQFLKGIELSVFVLTDGKSSKVLPPAKDYKPIGEGDTGLNTGGMGAVSPLPFADEAFMQKVQTRVIDPTIAGLAAEKISYQGFIFIGLMKVGEDPYVIEYNVRMGDPETEVVLPLLDVDMVELMHATTQGTLAQTDFKVKQEACVTVMLVSGGYPEKYAKGKVITGLDEVKGSYVFHAGTKQVEVKGEQQVVTNGGRVMALTSFGESLEVAIATSMANAELIQYEGKNYRKDIGQDVLALL